MDTGISANDGITNVGTMNVTGIVGVSWQYSTDGGGSWSAAQPSATTTFTPDPGVYVADAVLVRQTNAAGLTSSASPPAGAINFDIVAPTLLSIDDNFPDPGQVADGNN